MLRLSLCNYSDAYIHLSGTTTISGKRAGDVAKQLDEIHKRVLFKTCAPFTDCLSEISNTQLDKTKYIDVVMSMYYLTEYSNNSKTSGRLWHYYRDNANNAIRIIQIQD